MGERDAFGREKGEDSLAGMGWQSSGTPDEPPVVQSAAAATPAPARPAPADEPPPAWTPSGEAPVRRRRRRRRLPVVRLILLVAIVGGIFAGAGTVLERGQDAFDDVQGALKDATARAVPTATPSGLDSGSLFRPAALRAALEKLPAGSIQSLRVAPERIDAQVVAGGKMHVAQVTSGGEVRDVPTPVTSRNKRLRVDPGAPLRIVRTAARRSKRDPSRVSYLVLMSFSDTPEWQLFFDDGLHYSASANGRKVRRVG